MLELLEPLIFFVIAGSIALYIRYQGLPESTPDYKPPFKPDYPIHQEDHEYLDESDG